MTSLCQEHGASGNGMDIRSVQRALLTGPLDALTLVGGETEPGVPKVISIRYENTN